MCMAAARAHHAMLPLADDDVWVVLGGEPGGLLVDAEYYRVSQAAFSPQSGILSRTRTRHAAARVGPEMMIIAGGLDRDYALTASVEAAGQDVDFDPIGPLQSARAGSAVVSYPGGALVIGGWEEFGGDITERRASKAIDRITVSGGQVEVSNVGSLVLHEARAELSAVVFTEDISGKTRVLVCGGLTDATNATRSCEVVQPSEGQVVWLAEGDRDNLDVARWGHTSTILADGNVLIAGGFFPGVSAAAHNRAVILDPNTGQLVEQLVMRGKRGGHTATLMPNGMVLLAGGLAGPGEMASPAYEIFNP
jgi:hypothetical protein